MNEKNLTIVIIANSIKFGGRCVAGFLLTQKEDGTGYSNTRKWIRPIEQNEYSTISESAIYLKNKKRISIPMDVVSFNVVQDKRNVYHREDYVISPKPWRYLGSISLSKFINAGALEYPESLWIENDSFIRTDRIEKNFISKNKLQTLYFIRPDNFRLRIQMPNQPGNKKRTRAKFTYRNNEYDLIVTDDIYTRKYFPEFPKCFDEKFEKAITNVKAICVSLTEPFFDGFQYKIVASIL